MKLFLKSLPVVVIFIVWGIFAAPFFIKNETPFPARFQAAFFAPWNAYPEFGGPVKNEAMPDLIGQLYPWRKFTIDTWKQGSVPLWNPYSFSGTPHLANYQSAVFAPQNIGFFIFKFNDWWTFLVVLQPLLAGLFTYLYIRSLKLGSFPSVVSSLAFMFCGFMVTWMGYGTLGYAILYVPLGLMAIEKYFEVRRSWQLVLLALTIPLSFFSGHFQISIYFFLFVLAYIVSKFLQTRDLRTTFYVLLSMFFGFLLTAPQLFPSIELYTQSFRSTIFAKTEIIPWGYLPTFLSPDFYGNPVTGNDWYGHYAEWNAYIGLIPLFFALYSFFSKKKKVVYFFLIASVVSILLAFPSPLLDLLVLLKIPVLSTSAASRIIVLFSFSAAVLCAFGLEQFTTDITHKKFKYSYILLSFFALCFIALWGIAKFHVFLPVDKASIASSNLKLPTILFLAFVAGVLALRFLKQRQVLVVVLCAFVFLTAADLLRFTLKWQPYDPKSLMFVSTGVTRFLPTIANENRAFMNSGAEGLMANNLPGIEGYDAVYIRRYGQFIASLDTGKLSDSYRSVVSFPKNGKESLLAANLLGVKYIIHKTADGQRIWAFPFWKYKSTSIKLLFDDGHYQVLDNTNAFPRAFLVNNVIAETNPQKILNKMFSKNTNLRNTAVIEENLDTTLSSGSATITSYQPNQVMIKTISKARSFLVLTDVYYPGWNTYLNGQQTKIYRTDFAFRGIVVPEGNNTVVFKYEPKSFMYGVITAIIGAIGIVLLVILNRKKAHK